MGNIRLEIPCSLSNINIMNVMIIPTNTRLKEKGGEIPISGKTYTLAQAYTNTNTKVYLDPVRYLR